MMKKISTMACIALLAAGLSGADPVAPKGNSWLSDVSVSTSIKFENEHVYRGIKRLGKAFALKTDVGYRAFGRAEFYVGSFAAVGLHNSEASNIVGNRLNLISPYIGVECDLSDLISVDVGYEHNLRTSLAKLDGGGNKTGFKRNSSEIYAGLCIDTTLMPKLYCSYDIGCKDFSVEGSVGHVFDLSPYSIGGLSLGIGAKFGLERMKTIHGKAIEIGRKNYCYYGANADLIYEFSSCCSAKAGVYYEGNSAKKTSDILKGNVRNNVWFSASVDCSF
jgi:hypothetical protein